MKKILNTQMHEKKYMDWNFEYCKDESFPPKLSKDSIQSSKNPNVFVCVHVCVINKTDTEMQRSKNKNKSKWLTLPHIKTL